MDPTNPNPSTTQLSQELSHLRQEMALLTRRQDKMELLLANRLQVIPLTHVVNPTYTKPAPASAPPAEEEEQPDAEAPPGLFSLEGEALEGLVPEWRSGRPAIAAPMVKARGHGQRVSTVGPKAPVVGRVKSSSSTSSRASVSSG
jgi:hypothetical protein